MRCPSCQCEVPDAHRFCGSCGSPVSTVSQLPTAPGPQRPVSPVMIVESPAARIVSGDRSRGFTPGVVLAGRYRIIGLLGQGGMGEVYRADDIKLGTPVALKFLPPALAEDPVRRERFLAEVRIARQVAHPNVCRVFDIGDTGEGGQHFLSMEYIDGEDLASLLLRIGRLPADKALDIARQICAGVAAAHDRGVLHRDLKPANIMLDGRGRVRITDFGLAVAADAAGLEWDVSGTPAYMAPEQLAGKGASIRSDIYALGLVLYELYTGKRVFPSTSLADLHSRHRDMPAAPSELITDMDPAVERVILRAIAPDPRARPASVAQVAAALPGGNLLEAALRAGDTPSPEMVAASGPNDALEAPVAWTLLAVVVAGSVAAAGLGAQGLLWRRVVPDKPPEALAENARDMLAAFGYAGRPADRASGFEVDLEQLRYIQMLEPSRWRSIAHEPSVLRFWYRESPQPLEAWRFPYQYGNVSRITPADPPLDIAGMALVRLDPNGRLLQLVGVPPSTGAADHAARQPDWTALLSRAGFDPTAWRTSVPTRNPPVYADARAAWDGTWPSTPRLPVRLEAAALEGRPVYFEVVYPWTSPPRTPTPMLTSTERVVIVSSFVFVAAIVIGAAAFARRNVRVGRGDRRGAFRLAVFVFTAMLVSWFFGESHVATLWEVALVVMAVSWALAAAAFCWLAYLAVEPFLRRRWPEVLVSWTRLLAGELRDPLVGRDVLVGCAAAPALAVVAMAGFILPERLGIASNLVFVDVYGIAYGLQAVVPLLVWRSAQAVVAGLASVFVLLLLRIALRSQWAAVAAFVLSAALLVAGGGSSGLWFAALSTAIHFGAFALLIVRFGLLAAVVQFYVWGLFVFFPITADLAAWYAGAGVTALVVLAALSLFGFITAVGRRPTPGTSVA